MKIKLIFLAFSVLLMAACSEEQIGNYVFEKSLQSGLEKDCNKKAKPKECIALVKAQIKGCLKKSGNFASHNKSKDPNKTLKFVESFYPCFKDAEGKALF